MVTRPSWWRFSAPFNCCCSLKWGGRRAEEEEGQPLNKCERRSLFGTLGEILSEWLLVIVTNIMTVLSVVAQLYWLRVNCVLYCVGAREEQTRRRGGNKQIVSLVT